jgi:hypothetical protein
MSDFTSKFFYSVNDPDWENTDKGYLRPYQFSVIGGTNRTVEIRSIKEAVLANEFEQARSYKNIQVSISQSKFSVVAFAELIEVESQKMEFTFDLIVGNYSGKIHNFSHHLRSESATLKQKPIPVTNNAIALTIYFSAVEYHHAVGSGPKMVIENW